MLLYQLYLSNFSDYFDKADEVLVGQKYVFRLYL